MAITCECGHDKKLHGPNGCVLNGCGCEVPREQVGVKAEKAPDPKAVTFVIPPGFYAEVRILPVKDGESG